MPAQLQIQVVADTAQATAALQAVDRAAALTATRGVATLTQSAQGLRHAAGALSGTLLLIGGQRFPELTAAALTATHAVQGVRMAAQALQVSLGTVSVAVAAVTAAVATATAGWQKYKAELAETASARALEETLGLHVARLKEFIATLEKAGTLLPDKASALRALLDRHETKALDEELAKVEARLERIRKKSPLEQALGWLSPTAPGGASSEELALEHRRQQLMAEIAQRAQGRQAAVAEVRTELARISKEADEALKNTVAFEKFFADFAERELADAARQQAAAEAEASRELERQKALWESLLQMEREEAELAEQRRQAEIARVQSDWRLTEAQRWQRLNALGVQGIGPNPESFSEQLRYGFVRMLDDIGTAAQNAAAIVTNTLGAAFSRIGEIMADLILGAKTWSQALYAVGRTILSTLLQSVIQFFVNLLGVCRTFPEKS